MMDKFNANRFILQPSEKPNQWVCTDQVNKIVITFKENDFNNSQSCTMLEDFNPDKFMKVAQMLREMGDWLSENHYEKLF